MPESEVNYVNIAAQNKLICEALGLDIRNVLSIKMEFTHHGPKVLIDYFLNDYRGTQLAGAIASKKYEWVERVPKSSTYDSDGKLLFETEEHLQRN